MDGVHAFYVNGLLRALVFALVSIFTPVYIYTRAYALWGTVSAGLLAVAGFFLVQRFIILILSIPISKIIEKIGFRRSVTISVALCILYMAVLIAARQHFAYVWVAAVLLALNVPFYWIARDSALSQDASAAKMGKSLGAISALEDIAGIAGPFVAGVIILQWGFTALFTVSLVLLVISAVPLMWMPHHTHSNGVSFRGFWLWVVGRRYFHQALASMGQAMEDYGLTAFWPMALYLIGFNAGTLGTVFSVVAIVTVAVQLLSGVIFDRMRMKHKVGGEVVFGFATVGTAMVWLVRLFIFTVPQVVVTDVVGKIFQTVYYGFQSDYLHLGGKRMGSIAFWVYNEIAYSAASVFIFILMIVGVYCGVWKELVFLSSAWWVLVSVVQARETNLH